MGISIISLMLVPEPDRVTDLMNDCAWAAEFVENDSLFASDHAYM